MYNRVKELRSYYALSREAFGKRLGVSGDVINNLERNRVEISDIMIIAICAEFNVNERWLRTGEDVMVKNTDMQAIENLSKTHNLDELDRKILYEYITLPAEMRTAFKKYLLNLANFVNTKEESDIPEVIIDGEKITDPETATELKVIAREMSEEKKAAEKSSDSQSAKDA